MVQGRTILVFQTDRSATFPLAAARATAVRAHVRELISGTDA